MAEETWKINKKKKTKRRYPRKVGNEANIWKGNKSESQKLLEKNENQIYSIIANQT